MKTLVLYTFHEYNERVTYFIQNALFQRDDVDFLVICCDINDTRMETELPSYVKLMKRENIGFDFGAWADGLFRDNLYQNYNRFIFVNSSVIGPFYPHYYPGNWTDIYVSGLENNVKLFGSTINCIHINDFVPHVQSYIFAVDKECLDFLIQSNIFTNHYETNFTVLIEQKELKMSLLVLARGWNIGCLHKHYKDIDFVKNKRTVYNYKITLYNDVMYQEYLDKHVWELNELVFVKGNRISLPKEITDPELHQICYKYRHPHIPKSTLWMHKPKDA
jgi:lipopolysaccharide biosynthesis protein